ncbi:MAG: right-handed parallel beta-helix repeat-containing protein [Lentisphaeria bacterium]|nr:right-handed parallel beta-helix repeat-containing protein [Lentisphaeria bacterium]
MMMTRFLALAAAAAAASAQTLLYVSPTGDDGAPGTPQAPLASLAGARARVRALPAARGPVTVLFAEGTYRFAQPVAFESADSGREAAPVVYRAAEGAVVRFTGGVDVTGWQPVTDEAAVAALPREVRGHVRVADLRARGITDYGKLSVRGFAMGSPPAEAELFFDDQPMTLARWPNDGFRGVRARPDITTVALDSDRLARWTAEKDPWIFAYWHHDWAEIYEPILGIDAAAQTVTRSANVKPQYGITPGRARWYALNLLGELDAPGEYYLDRDAGRLYFWPPAADGHAVLSLAEGILRAGELSHVTFHGFIMEACRGTGVVVQGGTRIQVSACTLRNLGHRAVSVSGGARHAVIGCDIRDCGEGGISMSGGDRATLTPAGHNAENNHVHHYSRRCRTYKSAISVSGVGNRIAHNLIHDGPHMALAAGGNDHIVEYNEIHNVVYESGDAGAYYVGRDWTQRGNILRHNYWHQIVGATGHGGMTIYLDDQHCGHTIHGNVFERCSRAVFIGGGDDNTVTNNVFVDCWKAAHLDNRGMGWQKAATDDPNGTLRTRLRDMPYQNELWARRYPQLPNILDDDPNVPKRNLFARNVSAGGSWDDIHQGTRQYQTVTDNVVHDADKTWITLEKDATGRLKGVTFKDPKAVEAIGFEPIPVDRIGLYPSPLRASWPVAHSVRPIRLPEPEPPKPQAGLPPNPVLQVPRVASTVEPDGQLQPGEWQGLAPERALELRVHFDGTAVTPPARAWITHDGTSLRIALLTPLDAKRNLGNSWGTSDAVEIALKAADGANADTLVLRGFAGGTWVISDAGGAGQASLERLRQGNVRYAARVEPGQWSAEWILPLDAIGASPGDRLRFNLTLRRTADNTWVMWRPTHGDSTHCERVGTLELAP